MNTDDDQQRCKKCRGIEDKCARWLLSGKEVREFDFD